MATLCYWRMRSTVRRNSQSRGCGVLGCQNGRRNGGVCDGAADPGVESGLGTASGPRPGGICSFFGRPLRPIPRREGGLKWGKITHLCGNMPQLRPERPFPLRAPLDVPQSPPRSCAPCVPQGLPAGLMPSAGRRAGPRSCVSAAPRVIPYVPQGVRRTPSATPAHCFEDAHAGGPAQRPAPGIRRSCGDVPARRLCDYVPQSFEGRLQRGWTSGFVGVQISVQKSETDIEWFTVSRIHGGAR